MSERQWWAGRDEEFFTEGPFRFRTDAIDAGREEFEGDGFTVVEVTPQVFRLDAADLLDHQYFERDGLFDFDHMTPDWNLPETNPKVVAAKAALQAALDGWVAEHGGLLNHPNIFAATHHTEHFGPSYDDEEDDDDGDDD